MVTLSKYGAKYNRLVLNIEGLSSDSKPTIYFYEYDGSGREISKMQIQNGSIFTEIDTGNTYMYDAANTTWYQVSIGGVTPQGGIILVGETTTPLTDEATTNPITVDGQSYTAQPNDAVIYGSKEFLFDGTKWHEFGDLSGLNADMIDDTNTTNKFVTASDKTTWNGKQNALDQTQMDAVNSGITSADVAQITDNKNDILSEQAKTTGMTEGGSNYITVGGIRLYVASSAPTGDIPDGSVGVGWYEASEIVHRYQYGEWDGSPTPTYPVYGFKIDKNNDDPDTRVTYLYDAEGMTPAYMDFSNGTFNYGSWANAWFIKNNRPVALKFDGTVDYELNHTDFTKKLDGTASDVEDVNYAGNFMSEMPTVYVKRWEDSDYNYMAFCEIPHDEDFLAQAHTNANGTVNSAIYLPMFKGSVDSNNKMRSLMGTYPRSTSKADEEVTYTNNCGGGWQLWDKAKIDLILDLILLITKSTNCRAKIGNGNTNTYSGSGKMMSGYETDGTTRSVNAQFWGYEGTEVADYGKHHMCAFYIEDLWGNRMDRCLGFNIVNNVYKVKMIAPYALNSDSSYETLTVSPPATGWLMNISSNNTYGDVPTEIGASNSSGFGSRCIISANGNYIVCIGGHNNSGLGSGRYLYMAMDHTQRNGDVGASPCYNNLT